MMLLCGHIYNSEGDTVIQNIMEICCSIAKDSYFSMQSPTLSQSSSFKQEHVFPVRKSCSSSSAATGTQCSAGPHYWHSGGLTGFF